MRIQYIPRDHHFWLASLNQSGGSLGIYGGYRFQRGSGIGSFLARMFRLALPALKGAAKVVGKQALASTAGVVADLARGQEVLPSIESHGREAVATLADKLKNKMQSGSGRGRKRKRSRSRSKVSVKRRKISTRKPSVRKGKKRGKGRKKSRRVRISRKVNIFG